MSPELQFSFTGIVLAIIFAVSMTLLFRWMLSVPPQLAREVARARQSVKAWRRILVPIVGQVYSDRAIEMACRLGLDQKAQIFLACIVEVPRTIALDAEIPGAEKSAGEILTNGSEIVKLAGLEVQTIARRARQAGEEICALAERLEIDLVVMGIRKQIGAADIIFGRTSDVVLHHAPCEVLLDRLP